ncbi:AI-2E family transporter (plasmid) [Bacillus sp. 31A1R]|uniref:AI-2E family transporter n=1 Tax=Robertmurraya mangrovi TaxID=3098077 RepID=A0ABU5IUS9_9BACI|nr:AI-2E family transporter [Bacillus sp. 31A1R]MDZ5470879.1 AI-2E family transporter [Bacillus sp. 31A1R]
MDIRMKWFYRLGFLLLLLVVFFVFFKLQDIWMPALRVFYAILTPFLIAAFITYLLHPVVEKLHESNLPRWLAVLIIYTIFFGGIGMALYKGIPAFILQLRDLTENAPNFTNQYREWIKLIQQQTSTWPDGVQSQIDESIIALEKALNQVLENVLDLLMNSLNLLFLMAIIPFIAFYMLKDFDVMKKAAWYLTPRKWRHEGILFLRDVDQSLGNYIRGQLLVCVVIGGISALLFWLIGMRYPLLLGLIVGLTNIIPYFGPIIGAIPALIIAATISVKMVIYSLIIIFILQFLEGNILSPLIVGKSLHMHPLMIMFALIAGGEVGGIMGLILAVPILAILKVSLVHAKNHFVKLNAQQH